MKIKLAEKVVKSPRLLKEEKLEILACIKEEKDSEILECLLHEYDVPEKDYVEKKVKQLVKTTSQPSSTGDEHIRPRGAGLGYAIIHTVAKIRYKKCIKNASKIKDPSKRKTSIDACKSSLQTIKDYV